ncbi:phospholipase A1-like isoform X2 [Spodoptera frugiperda]|uniref:Phospholipase A1-like isoform X2 n=1 Tax=Spodoptera frugiperda TaxID=7108 RepID=A0A9R0EBA9_SPOFR|nr:phospholipase A1-like isoform X2 [Spodoptera frugiperda]
MAQIIWTAAVVLLAILQSTRGMTLKGYNGSMTNSLEVSWANASQLIDQEYIDVNRTVYIYVHGFGGNETTQGTDQFIQATINKGDRVVLVNWSEEAAFPDYFRAAKNTAIVGPQLGEALLILTASGLPIGNIVLVGMSLGAHVCGQAGYYVQIHLGTSVPLIVGLDAAKELFEPKNNIYRSIKRTDAIHVIGCHSDWLRFGMMSPYGTHDFFFNVVSYTLLGYQPGCGLVNTVLKPITALQTLNFNAIIFCSHRRMVSLWVEVVQYMCTMIGNQASSSVDWVARGGSPINLTCLSYNATQSHSRIAASETHHQWTPATINADRVMGLLEGKLPV